MIRDIVWSILSPIKYWLLFKFKISRFFFVPHSIFGITQNAPALELSSNALEGPEVIAIKVSFSDLKSFSSEKLLENYDHFIESVKKEKPDTIKGEFIKYTSISSTMGLSYKVGAK